MVSGRRLALALSFAAAALAGAAALLAIAWSHSTVDRPSAASATQAGREAQLDRFAFVPLGAFSPPEPSPTEQPWGGVELKPGIRDDNVAIETWSTESRSEPPPRRATGVWTLLPTLRGSRPAARPEAPRRSYSLGTRMAEIAPGARARLAAKFESAKAAWPPSEVAFIAIKDEKALELYGRQGAGAWQFVYRYRVLAASGSAGPKLRQGDRQVPEGLYGIAFLNPNSAYHVSMGVSYPNAFDRQMASLDGRHDLGGDIMIHGKNLSAGCLAMGDEAAEELFVLAAQTGPSNVRMIIAPSDFRDHGVPAPDPNRPAWLPKLYGDIATAMAEFKPPHAKGLLSFFMK